ncbi:MAG: hypothetical protein ACE5F7_09045 [Nitrospiria bacterium]
MEQFCEKETLVSAPNAMIQRCSCGTYHVEFDSVTLHLSSAQFTSVARVFKLALGMLSVQRKTEERIERMFYVK